MKFSEYIEKLSGTKLPDYQKNMLDKHANQFIKNRKDAIVNGTGIKEPIGILKMGG